MPNHKLLHNIQGIKSTVYLLAAVTALSLFSHKVEAEVLFEGYYKVGLSGVHSGYVIQRYELDSKKREFTGSYFAYVRLSPDGKQYLNESLVAKSDDAFNPIKYQYSKLQNEIDPNTNKIKSSISTIDANYKKLKNGRLQGTLKGIKDGKNFSAKPLLDKNMFLSNFLLYLMLQKGLQAGRSFAFEAIAEESGDVQKGQASIKSEEKYHGLPAYKLDWTYKDIRSISFISTTGEALATESTTQGVTQELVATKAAAVANFNFPEKSVKAVFNGIPDGKINAVFKAENEPKKAPSVSTAKPTESLNSTPTLPTKPKANPKGAETEQ